MLFYNKMIQIIHVGGLKTDRPAAAVFLPWEEQNLDGLVGREKKVANIGIIVLKPDFTFVYEAIAL